MDYLEIVGTLLGVLYLYWEYKASAWLWLASIAMPTVYLEVYYNAGLYADFGISIYYILASIYGLICWLSSKNHATETSESSAAGIALMPRSKYAAPAIGFTLTFIVIGLILSRFTDSNVPWADAFTTALSIVAMWMLAHKYLEQWLVWIVADVACSALYIYKGLWFTAALYLAYAVVAIFGYKKWKQMMYENNKHHT